MRFFKPDGSPLHDKNEFVDYIIPSDYIVIFKLKIYDYFQTINSGIILSGSLLSIDMIKKDDLILGSYKKLHTIKMMLFCL